MKKVVDNLGYLGGVLFLVGMLVNTLMGRWDAWVQGATYLGLALVAVYLLFKLPLLIATLRTQRGAQGASALVTLALAVGILVLLNFLNYRHHERKDFSEGGLNTLSDQTEKVLASLDRDVQVVGFFTNSGQGDSFRNLMKEYRFLSPRVDYEVIDPQQDPTKIELYQIESDGTIVVLSGEKQQKVTRTSEEELTNAILKVVRDEDRSIYFLTGHNEHSLSSSDGKGYLAAKGALERENYVVQSFNLATEGALPQDASVIVAAGPEVSFLPRERELLDQYLAQGGKLLLMLDPQTRFEMDDFLAQYGVQPDNNLIVDFSLVGQLAGGGPAAPAVNVYQSHPIVEDFELLTVFPLAQSLSQVESSLGYTVSSLFSSSGQSFGETEVVDGKVGFDEGKDKRGPLPLALVSVLSQDTPDELGGDVPEELEKPKAPESRIVVVGDSDFAANSTIDQAGNSDLFLNMVAWLADDADLISVRPKDPTNRTITLTESDSRVIFLCTVILLPLATLLFGISVWYRRR